MKCDKNGKKIKVGDKVKILSAEYAWGAAKPGMLGIIGAHSSDGDLELIVFANEKEMEENRCVHPCWRCLGKDVELVEPEKKPSSVSFKIENGQTISDYVKKLLGVEKNASRKKLLQTFDNCVLDANVQKQIDSAIMTVLRRDVFDSWGLSEQFEKGITNSILLYGKPGCGKTMIAESIAAVLDKNLMMVGTAELQSQIPGEMERNIIKMFEQAKKQNAVLLLDECDSLLSSRELVGVVMGAEINTLLTQLERYDGVVILTTNRISRLDAALARRIISKIEVLPPTQNAQIEIWSKLVPTKMPLDKNVNFKALAKKYDMTGGEIKNAILLAARTAIASGADKVTMEDFEFGAISSLHAKDDFLQADDVNLFTPGIGKKKESFMDNQRGF